MPDNDAIVTLKPIQLRVDMAPAADPTVVRPDAAGVTADDARRYFTALLEADPKFVDALWNHTYRAAGAMCRLNGLLDDMFREMARAPAPYYGGPGSGARFLSRRTSSVAIPRSRPLTAAAAAQYLNEVLHADPALVRSIVETRFPCDDSKLVAPYIVIGDAKGEVGFLGVLNGLLRPVGQAVAVDYDDADDPVEFRGLRGADLPVLTG